MIGEIKINCDGCGKGYWRPLVRGQKRTQDLIFDYSVCPFCGTPRNAALHRTARARCVVCDVPVGLLGGPAARGMCWRDYKAARRKEKLLKQPR